MWKYIKRYLPYAILAALFMIAEVLMDLLQPGLMSRIIDDGVIGVNNGGVGDMELILGLGLKMIGIAIIGGICGSMNNVFVQLAGQNVGNEMRKDSFSRIMSFSFSQVDKYSTGSLITRVTNDITQVQAFLSHMVRGMIRTLLLTFGSISFMFRLNLKFGFIVLGIFPFLIGIMAVCLAKGYPLFWKLQSELDDLNSILQEDISALRIIKACVREAYEKMRFGKANDKLIKTQLRILGIFAFMNPMVNALIYFAITLILITGSRDVKLGATTPGVIMAGISYTTTLLQGTMMLVMVFQNIARGIASWKRVKEILDSEAELKDGGLQGSVDGPGRIEFCNVSFSYPGSQRKVLDSIDIKIEAGETVAIMGATGSGKTTLIQLIARFYDVSKGRVLLNGINVRDYPLKVLREKVAIALQRTELFSGTIRENILWGKPEASGEEIYAAAKIAQAESFINSTPQGFDTILAERGMSLSGGQKQRIAIARAVLKDAEVLIFDDSTSALDLKTEAHLYAALKEAKPGCTKIIVAQRIASARHADRIIVLDKGSVVAIGSHEELLKSCPIYQDIYSSQMGEEVAMVEER